MNIWDFLDDFNIEVYCISLVTRDDRYRASRFEFQRVGLLPRIKYLRPIKDSDDGRRGCWTSHKTIIESCSERGPVLIFEDDVCFTDFWRQAARITEEFLRSGQQWDMFFMGGLIRCIDYEFLHPSVYKASVLCTHAYFINTHYVKFLRQDGGFNPNIYKSLHMDCYFARSRALSFILKEQSCLQSIELTSDNTFPFLPTEFFQYMRSIIFKLTGWNTIDVNNWLVKKIGWLNPLTVLIGLAERIGIMI